MSNDSIIRNYGMTSGNNRYFNDSIWCLERAQIRFKPYNVTDHSSVVQLIMSERSSSAKFYDYLLWKHSTFINFGSTWGSLRFYSCGSVFNTRVSIQWAWCIRVGYCKQSHIEQICKPSLKKLSSSIRKLYKHMFINCRCNWYIITWLTLHTYDVKETLECSSHCLQTVIYSIYSSYIRTSW